MSTIHTSYFYERKQNAFFQNNEDAGDVCIANISPLERQKRLRFGIWQFIFTLVILGVLMVLQVNPFWRLPLLFLFWASATGYFQARDKT
jgi:hypothetical protein